MSGSGDRSWDPQGKVNKASICKRQSANPETTFVLSIFDTIIPEETYSNVQWRLFKYPASYGITNEKLQYVKSMYPEFAHLKPKNQFQ